MSAGSPRILIEAHPHLRVMWLPGSHWGAWYGDGSYYGWRWWLGFGPLLLLIGQARDPDPPPGPTPCGRLTHRPVNP